MARVMKVNLTEFWTIRRAFQQAALIGFKLGMMIKKAQLSTMVTPNMATEKILSQIRQSILLYHFKNDLIIPTMGTFCTPYWSIF